MIEVMIGARRVARASALGLALAGTGLATSLADAQTVAGPADASAAAGDAKVGEVVVTATRRAERNQDVPVSTSVVTPGEVAVIFSAGGDIRALANTTPSLNIESSNGRTFPRLYIRGYGNTDFTSFASQPVSLVYDDVVQENPALKGFPVFDVADVEVLRGPQGTLFGRNAPAGVVNVQSAKPALDSTALNFSVSDGTYNTANVEGMINLPVGDKVAVRVSVQDQHRDNWVDDPISHTSLEGYDDFGGRIQLLYKPDDSFSALFNLHGRKLDGSARLFRANVITKGTNDLVAGFNPAKIYIDGKNTQTFSSIGGNARLSWNLGPVTLFSVTGVEKILNYFTEGDIDGGYGASYAPPYGPGFIPFAVETSGGISDHTQITQEVRAQSNYSGKVNWQSGVYYFHENVSAPSTDYDMLGKVVTDFNISRQINDAAAVFGSIDYKPTDRLELRAGARYTYDHKKFDVTQAYNQTFAAKSSRATGSNTSWDVSGTYKLQPDVSLYSRIATGFRAPSFGAPSATQGIQIARSETNISGEIGVKSFLFDHRARLDVDFYYYDVSHQQLTAVGGATDNVQLLNAKKTIGDGIEVEFEERLIDHLVFKVAASYNFTKIEDPMLLTGYCATCTVTNTIVTIGKQSFASINGNPLPQAPKYVVDPSLQYTFPFDGGSEAFFYTDLAYRSSIDIFLYQSKEFTGQAFANLGLRAGYRWDHGRYEVAAFCRNCLSQIRLVGGIDFENLTGFINDPVIAGVQFSAKL